jgi:hypothetical protein
MTYAGPLMPTASTLMPMPSYATLAILLVKMMHLHNVSEQNVNMIKHPELGHVIKPPMRCDAVLDET